MPAVTTSSPIRNNSNTPKDEGCLGFGLRTGISLAVGAWLGHEIIHKSGLLLDPKQEYITKYGTFTSPKFKLSPLLNFEGYSSYFSLMQRKIEGQIARSKLPTDVLFGELVKIKKDVKALCTDDPNDTDKAKKLLIKAIELPGKFSTESSETNPAFQDSTPDAELENKFGKPEIFAQLLVETVVGEKLPSSLDIKFSTAEVKEVANNISGFDLSHKEQIRVTGDSYASIVCSTIHEIGHQICGVGEISTQDLMNLDYGSEAREEAAAFCFTRVALSQIKDSTLRKHCISEFDRLRESQIERFLQGDPDSHAIAMVITDACLDLYGLRKGWELLSTHGDLPQELLFRISDYLRLNKDLDLYSKINNNKLADLREGAFRIQEDIFKSYPGLLVVVVDSSSSGLHKRHLLLRREKLPDIFDLLKIK